MPAVTQRGVGGVLGKFYALFNNGTDCLSFNWVITTLKFWKSYNYFAGAVLPVCTQSKIEEVFKAYILVGKNPGLKGVTQIASAFPELQDCDPMKIHAYIKDRLARLK